MLKLLGAFLLPFTIAIAPAAARSISTTIAPSRGPVTITGCRAALSPFKDEDDAYDLTVWLDFKNTGSKTATAVRFTFRVTDAFGMPLQSTEGDRLGTFAPGVLIQNWLGSNAKAMGGLPQNVGSVTCGVEMVQFSDGSQWRGVNAMPTLFYPPTPGPPRSR